MCNRNNEILRPEDATRSKGGQTSAMRLSFTQGDFAVSVLSDGYISVPGEIFAPELESKSRQAALSHLDMQNGEVHAQANIPLFRSRMT